MFLSTLKSTCHKLRRANGLNLMIHRLCGWEAFSTLGAIIHSRITWALSPIVPQVRVSLRCLPCALGVLGALDGEGRNIVAKDLWRVYKGKSNETYKEDMGDSNQVAIHQHQTHPTRDSSIAQYKSSWCRKLIDTLHNWLLQNCQYTFYLVMDSTHF